MKEYTIIGDTEKYGPCLIYVCGRNKAHAEKVLKQMLENPSENDKVVMRGHTNIRINEVDSKSVWWNDPVLRN